MLEKKWLDANMMLSQLCPYKSLNYDSMTVILSITTLPEPFESSYNSEWIGKFRLTFLFCQFQFPGPLVILDS